MEAITIFLIIVHIIFIALAAFGIYVLWQMRDTLLDSIKWEFKYYWRKFRWKK